MSTFSLLQKSLDHSIDRASLEDASVVARSIARADCARLQRELFGIVASGLDRSEALAFQAELLRRGLPTDCIEDRAIPALDEPFTIQRIDIFGETLRLGDTLGRTQSRPLSDLVFIAGGFLNDQEIVTKRTVTRDYSTNYPSRFPVQVINRESHVEPIQKLVLDFFFTARPRRFQAVLRAENVFFYQQFPLRLKHGRALLPMLGELRHLLPQDRVTRGLSATEATPFYPSYPAYEEEIRWHFLKLASPSP